MGVRQNKVYVTHISQAYKKVQFRHTYKMHIFKIISSLSMATAASAGLTGLLGELNQSLPGQAVGGVAGAAAGNAIAGAGGKGGYGWNAEKVKRYGKDYPARHLAKGGKEEVKEEDVDLAVQNAQVDDRRTRTIDA